MTNKELAKKLGTEEDASIRSLTSHDILSDAINDDVKSNSAKEIFQDHDSRPWNDDPVYHPLHYQLANGLEAIDVIDAAISDELMTPIEGYYTGQVLKYIVRWKRKNGLEDLKKARWYLDRLIHKFEEGVEHEVEKELGYRIKIVGYPED